MAYIKVTVTDVDALQAIRMEDVITYLEATGWERMEQQGDRLVFGYEYEKDGVATWVSGHNNSGDHAIRLSELLMLVAKMEGRSALDVFEAFGGRVVL